MTRIIRLPADLANQIAAGEVVERPASVVKELVENALDAGARRVRIDTELGGKRLVRVEDDGEGMEPDDARLAVERHATSKIRDAHDLAAIRTLGFRGEALPSIASVSRFVLRTRARGGQPGGWEIRVEGGAVQPSVEVGTPEGTIVEVCDLFYNLPARRKFLKADAAESAQVSRSVGKLALAHPEVGFLLTSGGRQVLHCPPAGTVRDRLFQLYGDRPDLVEVRKEVGWLRVRGYVSPVAGPGSHGSTRGPQNLFVNRRAVNDRTISHAILDAYRTAAMNERAPEVHLFLDLAPDAVDVNVHPAKAEVRFRDPSFVHDVVRRALMEAIGDAGVPRFSLKSPVAVRDPTATMIPGMISLATGARASGPLPAVAVPPESLGSAAVMSAWAFDAGRDLTTALGAGLDGSDDLVTAQAGLGNGRPGPQGGPGSGAGDAGTIDALPVMPLGQFRDTFIVAVDHEGIAIIDQHVAHERVLFERIMQRLASGRLESQRLLVPMMVDVSPAAHEVLVARAADLDRFGFEIESFGPSTLKVTAVPAVIGVKGSANALLALGEDLEGLDRSAPVQQALQRIAATTACHAAVKANDPLTFEKMEHILAELRATRYSTVCPHGRPVMLRLTRREIEKNFERI